MEDEIVSFLVAKLARDKGFKEDCWLFYDNGSTLTHSITKVSNKMKLIAAPTQSLLQRWLREKHGIYIELIVDGWGDDNCISSDNLCYRAFIYQVGQPKPGPADDLGASSYEKILEVALQDGLNLISK